MVPAPYAGMIEYKSGIKMRTCLSRVCSNENIVWAKLAGYRAWPARIIGSEEYEEVPEYKKADQYRTKDCDTLVVFFGTNDIAWVQYDKSITPWKAGMMMKFDAKGGKSKTFKAALKQVHAYCEEKSGVVL